jgi:hypothetical protein
VREAGPDRGPHRPWWDTGWVRGVWRFLYYLALIAALAALYGQGHYRPPPFVYQGF